MKSPLHNVVVHQGDFAKKEIVHQRDFKTKWGLKPLVLNLQVSTTSRLVKNKKVVHEISKEIYVKNLRFFSPHRG